VSLSPANCVTNAYMQMLRSFLNWWSSTVVHNAAAEMHGLAAVSSSCLGSMRPWGPICQPNGWFCGLVLQARTFTWVHKPALMD